jgi:hypothetical protein
MGSTDPTSAPASPPLAQRLAPFRTPFVWGLWALLSAGLVGYAWMVNDDFPIADDWNLVPVYTGSHPEPSQWLWEQYNEHRMPLSKVLLVLGAAVTGHDYRTGVLLNALALSALAALMILAAGRLRGGPSFADAFFPLALLHWGQYETLLISFALNLVASTALLGLALLIVVGVNGVPTLRQGVLFGLILLALPLCGSNGAALVPALALWLACIGVGRWRSGSAQGRRDGAILIGLVLAATALVGFYLHSLEKMPASPPRPTASQAGQSALAFLSDGLGPIAGDVVATLKDDRRRSPNVLADALRRLPPPVAGLIPVVLAVVLVAVLAILGLLTTLKLARDWRREPAQRLRTLGLACVGGALLCLAAGIGWGRGAMGLEAAFGTRYVTMAVPAFCLIYLVWRPVSGNRVASGLCLLMGVLFLFSTWEGVVRAEARRERMHELQADVAAGLTPKQLADKWAAIICAPHSEESLTSGFEMMRRTHQGPYKGRAD